MRPYCVIGRRLRTYLCRRIAFGATQLFFVGSSEKINAKSFLGEDIKNDFPQSLRTLTLS